MKSKKYIYTILVLILGVVTSCYEDKNNYDLSAINEAIITTSEEDFAVEQLSELIITPEISHTLAEGDDYSYEWKIIEPISDNDYFDRDYYNEVIATTKDLKAIIYAPAGNYMLLYTVKNNQTGVSNYKEFDLTVNSGFYEGLIVAYDKDSHSELGFIRKDGNIGYDLIHQLNGIELESTVQLNSLIVKQLKYIALTTANNHYLIDPDAFTIMSDKRALFPTSIEHFEDSYIGGNKVSGYGAPSDVFYINDGKVHADIGPDFGGVMAGMYSQSFYYAGGDYHLFPFMFNGRSGATIYFYDNLNKRFLQCTYNGRELKNTTMRSGDNFDPASVDKTALAAMMGYNQNIYYVMSDAGNYYIYTMQQFSATIANSIIQIDLANCPDFAQATRFDGRSDQRFIYYAAGNKLYAYNLQTNKAQQVLALQTDEQIADIHVFRANMWQNTTDENFNKRIYIASNNGSNGKIYQYELLEDGMLSASPEKEFEGFGKIVDIDYRNPNE